MNVPKRLLSLVPAVLLGGLLLGPVIACDVEEVPVEQRMCERFDACNYFAAGVSVEDCTDVMEMCTGDLLSSQHRDWTREAEAALDKENCGNFLDEYQEASACTISNEGSVDDTPGNPTSDDDDDDDADGSGSGGSSSGGSTEDPDEGRPTCGEDRFECVGTDRISACIDDESIDATCDEICASGENPMASAGCGYSEQKGHDVCFCEDLEPEEPTPPGPEGPGPGPAPGE